MTLPRRLRPTPEQRLQNIVGAQPGLAQGQSKALRPVRHAPPAQGRVLTGTGAVVGGADFYTTEQSILSVTATTVNGALAVRTVYGDTSSIVYDPVNEWVEFAEDGWYQVSLIPVIGAIEGDIMTVSLLTGDDDTFNAYVTAPWTGTVSPSLSTIPLYRPAGQTVYFGISNPAKRGSIEINSKMSVVRLAS